MAAIIKPSGIRRASRNGVCSLNSLNLWGALLGSQQNGAKGTEISHIHVFTHMPSPPPHTHQHHHGHGTFVTLDKLALTRIITTQRL